MVGVVIGIGFSPAMAESIEDLQKIIADKDLIIQEQIKVIMHLKDNFKQTYEPFSLEQFPDTEGFNPAWLQGEKHTLKKDCDSAISMGFEPKWCKYV